MVLTERAKQLPLEQRCIYNAGGWPQTLGIVSQSLTDQSHGREPAKAACICVPFEQQLASDPRIC
jgi:hypothetical protein